MIELETRLSPFRSELRKVVGTRRLARNAARGLSAIIAPCQIGPWERTTWIDLANKELGHEGRVQIIRPSETQNHLAIVWDNEVLAFPLYFGTIDAEGNYRIHPKGDEQYSREGWQMKFELEFDEVPTQASSELQLYGLAIIKRDEEDGEAHELHLISGEQPYRDQLKSALIKHYERYIVTESDPFEHVAAFEPPFTPEGVE